MNKYASITLAVIIVAALPTAANAGRGGGNPRACKYSDPGELCVPARCPERSQGRPCNPVSCRKKARECGTGRPTRVIPLASCDATHDVGQLIVRDEDRDGIVEYRYAWSGPGLGEGDVGATWNGKRAIPDKPIPLIAAMAEYGWRVTDSHSDANVDRVACSTATKEAATIKRVVAPSLRADKRYSVAEHDTATAWWIAQMPPEQPVTSAPISNSDPDAATVNPIGTTVTT